MKPTSNNTSESKSLSGWRKPLEVPSLSEVFSSIRIPIDARMWRKVFAFAGPGLMVAVGYMDPGNWATDLAGGAKFGYTLLSVILFQTLWRFCCSIFL